MYPARVPQQMFLLVAAMLALCVSIAVARAEASQARPDIEQLLFPSPLDFIVSFESEADPTVVDNFFGPSLLSGPSQRLLTVRPSFPEQEFQRGKRLLSINRHVLWEVLATSSLFKGTLYSQGTWTYSPADPGPVASYGEAQQQLLRLTFNGQRDGFAYGAEYRYVAKDVELPTATDLKRDREGIEIWGTQKFGVAVLRTSLSDFWNNVENDPQRSRLTTIEGKIALDLALPAWPLVRVSYARGSATRSQPSNGSQAEPHWVETIGALIYHGTSAWEVTLSSTYSPITDSLEAKPRTLTFNHELSMVYRPTRFFTIAPTMSFYEEIAPLSQTRLMTPSASLSLTHNQLGDWVDVTLYGSYSRAFSNDGWVNNRTINTTMSLVWKLSRSPLGKTSLAFEVAYYRYVDAIYRESSSEELTGSLQLKITSL